MAIRIENIEVSPILRYFNYCDTPTEFAEHTQHNNII